MEVKLQNHQGTHLFEGDYFIDVPIFLAKLEYAETFEDMKIIVEKHLKYKHDVTEVFSDGNGETSCVVFQLEHKNEYKVLLTIHKEV